MGRVQGTPTLPYPSLPPLPAMNGGCHQINLRHVKSKCHYDAPWKTPTAVVCLAPVLCHRRRRRHYQAAAATTRPPPPSGRRGHGTVEHRGAQRTNGGLFTKISRHCSLFSQQQHLTDELATCTHLRSVGVPPISKLFLSYKNFRQNVS